MLVAGTAAGACSVLALNESMWVSPKEEKAAINTMLEREGLRCVHSERFGTTVSVQHLHHPRVWSMG
jgi:hypothetical protein